MPDQPSPKDAAEAALLDECWDAVLSYAGLCTAGSAAAGDLAAEGYALGLREVRAADAGASRGRPTSRLPRIPLMLGAVRATAASWEAEGSGHRLDPDLRLWLGSPQAARRTGPPRHRPLALRGLRDLREADAALLWLAEVEALPLAVVARRLALDPATLTEELQRVRARFRDRCHRNHLDTPLDAECRSYARLLDAVTRTTPVAEAPEDLSRHLATCARCAEAADCLRLHGGTLPAALAGGVIGWGGLAYLERRRRAAEARLDARRTTAAADERAPQERGTIRARAVRGGLLAAAVALSALALAVSLMPFGGSADDGARGGADGRPVADPGALPPSALRSASPGPGPGRSSASASEPPPASASAPSARATATGAGPQRPDPEPQGSSSPTSDVAAPDPSATGPGTGNGNGTETCRVRYEVLDQWAGGFRAGVTVTTGRPLDGWQVAWTFRDGQHVDQMWDATVAQRGARVTAGAAAYDRSVPAGGTLSFGFVATWHGRNSAPAGFTLDGHGCTPAQGETAGG
jgi:hypothetical protein